MTMDFYGVVISFEHTIESNFLSSSDHSTTFIIDVGPSDSHTPAAKEKLNTRNQVGKIRQLNFRFQDLEVPKTIFTQKLKWMNSVKGVVDVTKCLSELWYTLG